MEHYITKKCMYIHTFICFCFSFVCSTFTYVHTLRETSCDYVRMSETLVQKNLKKKAFTHFRKAEKISNSIHVVNKC